MPTWNGFLNSDLVLAQLDLVGVANLLEVLEPGRAEMLVDLLLLIAGVQGPVSASPPLR